jgi:hypothetical protein
MTAKPSLSSRDIERLIRAAPTGSPEYKRLNLAFVRAAVREARETYADRARRAALRTPLTADELRVIANDTKRWLDRIDTRQADDDETALTHADNLRWDRERREAEEPGSLSAHEISVTEETIE